MLLEVLKYFGGLYNPWWKAQAFDALPEYR